MNQQPEQPQQPLDNPDNTPMSELINKLADEIQRDLIETAQALNESLTDKQKEQQRDIRRLRANLNAARSLSEVYARSEARERKEKERQGP